MAEEKTDGAGPRPARDEAWEEFARHWRDTYFRDPDPKDQADRVNFEIFKVGWEARARSAGAEAEGWRGLAGRLHLFLLKHPEVADPERAELLRLLAPYRRRFGEIVEALTPGGGGEGEDSE